MVKPLRFRFWLETAVAVVAAGLSILTLMWPRWPERVFDVTVDWPGRSKWIFAAALMVAAVALLLLARYEWRAAQSGRSRTTPGRVSESPEAMGSAGGEVLTTRRTAYNPAKWTKAYAQKRQVPTFAPFKLHLDTEEQARIRAATAPLFSHRSRSGQDQKHAPNVAMTPIANPAPRASLGYAGPVVKVEASEPFFMGVLVFPLEPAAIRKVVAETVRV